MVCSQIHMVLGCSSFGFLLILPLAFKFRVLPLSGKNRFVVFRWLRRAHPLFPPSPLWLSFPFPAVKFFFPSPPLLCLVSLNLAFTPP